MSKLTWRVEQLEERMGEHREQRASPWLQKAMEPLTDEDLALAREFLGLCLTDRVAEATPEQWAAIQMLAREEARLKEEAVRNGENCEQEPILLDALDELSRSTI
jgi:hypothetical protein